MPEAAKDIARCFQYRGDGDPDVVTPWFHIECKVGRTVSVATAIKQAVYDASVKETLMPVVVVKNDYGQPFVALPLNDFGRLVSALWQTPEARERLRLRELPEEP